MPSTVEISNHSEDGELLTAIYATDKGMNFISFKKGEIEAIDQSTRPLFEERCAGLGAMIGPHFYRRKAETIPPPVKAVDGKDPFSHGIGRYVPWMVEKQNKSMIHAKLKGSDMWQGHALKDLEGQDFAMEYLAEMTPRGLEIHLSVVSEFASIVGLHTYYALAGGKGRVVAQVQGHYNDQGEIFSIPPDWNYQKHHLIYELDRDTDFAFHPYPDPLYGKILLETGSHRLQVQYWSNNEENAWQLWHPKGSSFVCIEPVSAKNPRKVHLSVSQIKILLSIL